MLSSLRCSECSSNEEELSDPVAEEEEEGMEEERMRFVMISSAADGERR